MAPNAVIAIIKIPYAWTLTLSFSSPDILSIFPEKKIHLMFQKTILSLKNIKKQTNNKYTTFARLITYFGNFVFDFSSLRFCDFQYNVFHFQEKMGRTKWKINAQTIT